MSEEMKENKSVSRKGWFKVIFLFAILITVSTFFAPQRATVVQFDLGAGEKLDESYAVYLEPFWGSSWANDTFHTFEKSIVVKGRFPHRIPGKQTVLGIATPIGDKQTGTFAWDLWLIFYVLPSFVIAFLLGANLYRDVPMGAQQ